MKHSYYAAHKSHYTVKRLHVFYHMFTSFLSWVYPDYDVHYEVKPTTEETVVVVSNHCKLHGPLSYKLKFDQKQNMVIWATQELCFFRTATRYMVQDFFPNVSPWGKPWVWFLCFLLTPIFVLSFRGGEVVPVYRDARLMTTFRKTQEQLAAGKTVVIFPESPERRTKFVNEFNSGFSDVATLYYRQCGKKKIRFYPAYLSPELRVIRVGVPIEYDPQLSNAEQRRRINDYLMAEIERLGASLPDHTVINF